MSSLPTVRAMRKRICDSGMCLDTSLSRGSSALLCWDAHQYRSYIVSFLEKCRLTGSQVTSVLSPCSPQLPSSHPSGGSGPYGRFMAGLSHAWQVARAHLVHTWNALRLAACRRTYRQGLNAVSQEASMGIDNDRRTSNG